MNETIRKIVENLDALRYTRIEEVNVQLTDLITACRAQLEEQSARLAVVPPTAENYATLINEMKESLELVRVVVKAASDMDGLQANATRVMDRVYKKLPALNTTA